MSPERGICPKTGNSCIKRTSVVRSIRVCDEIIGLFDSVDQGPLSRRLIDRARGVNSTREAAISLMIDNRAALAGYLALNCSGETCIITEALEQDEIHEVGFFNPELDREIV